MLTLADGMGSQQRSAFSKTRQVITNFAARFIYRPSVRFSGAAFVLQNSASGAGAIGGGRLGLGGLAPAASIFFDIRNIGTFTGYATNGSIGISSSTLPLDLGRGNPIAVTLIYNGSVLTENLLDLNTGKTFETNYVVNLAAAVGNTNTAFVGFTGASGTAAASQLIESFSFGPYVVPPSLQIHSIGNQLAISWPSTNDYVLEVTERLPPPVIWSTAPQPHLISSNQTTVTVPVGMTNRFYRLRVP
jgi:hypothetical protein